MSLPPRCHDAIVSGLELLLAARLRWAPIQSDDIERTGAAWLIAARASSIPWCDEYYPGHVQRAFARLAATESEWPAPAKMIALLPAQLPPRALPHKRAPPSARQIEKMNEILLRTRKLAGHRRLEKQE